MRSREAGHRALLFNATSNFAVWRFQSRCQLYFFSFHFYFFLLRFIIRPNIFNAFSFNRFLKKSISLAIMELFSQLYVTRNGITKLEILGKSREQRHSVVSLVTSYGGIRDTVRYQWYSDPWYSEIDYKSIISKVMI